MLLMVQYSLLLCRHALSFFDIFSYVFCFVYFAGATLRFEQRAYARYAHCAFHAVTLDARCCLVDMRAMFCFDIFLRLCPLFISLPPDARLSSRYFRLPATMFAGTAGRHASQAAADRRGAARH